MLLGSPRLAHDGSVDRFEPFISLGLAVLAGLLLGLVLVADLVRADLPWIRYYDYRERFAASPVVDFLAAHTEQARVVAPPLQINQNYSQFQQFYFVEWLQHNFPYYNIRTLDVSQEPRPPVDKANFVGALGKDLLRYWQLTNTRYLFGVAPGFVDQLNQQLDPVEKRFKELLSFTLGRKPDNEFIEAATTDNGPFALIEFAGALPRAQLYPAWQTITNDQAMLTRLADPSFNPAQSVIVADELPASTNSSSPIAVDASSYAPLEISFKTSAPVPAVLLLNERFDPRWQVTIDGTPQKTLRCNFIMRGVLVPPGTHTVVFRYKPSATTFYVSAGAEIFGLLLCGFLFVTRPREAQSKSSKTKS